MLLSTNEETASMTTKDSTQSVVQTSCAGVEIEATGEHRQAIEPQHGPGS